MRQQDYHDALREHKRRTKKRATSKDEIVHGFRQPCDREFTATGIYGTRKKEEIIAFVLHGTQGKTGPGGARQTAGFFASGGTTGSTQLVVDGNICYRMMDDLEIAAGVSDVNTETLHLETASLAFWQNLTWFLPFNRRMLQRTAWKIAHELHKFNIPNRFLSIDDINNGWRTHRDNNTPFGWTLHYCLSNSNVSTSTHQDPFNPHSWVCTVVKRYVNWFYDHPQSEVYKKVA